jgi:ParB family transcriptional regulator, chromosome partitioning protein
MTHDEPRAVKKRGLGRGLDALLGGGSSDDTVVDVRPADLAEIAIADIHRGPFQPRREIRDEGIQELAASIRSQGVMQPIVLRRRVMGGYEIIAGERRWRAAQLAGLDRIPAVVKEVSDDRAVAMALIENIQREDLNPLEEAGALQRLIEEFQLTQQQVADSVGKSRVAVTNLLRLLNLATPVREMLGRGDLEMGHARALLALAASEQLATARLVVERALSVRQTEALVRKLQAPRTSPKTRAPKDADVKQLERELSERIGAPVAISDDGRGRGKVVITYTSLDELDGILRHLK